MKTSTPIEVVKDVSNQLLSANNNIGGNKIIARKQNQAKAAGKDSESKKREDLTSLGSDDSGKVICVNRITL
jgi:hypothetical protein